MNGIIVEGKDDSLGKQGSKGISQWPKNLCIFQMAIHKITPAVDYNQWLKSLNTQLNDTINQNTLKSPKL